MIEAGGYAVQRLLADAVQLYRMLSPTDRLLARQLMVDGEVRRIQMSLTSALPICGSRQVWPPPLQPSCWPADELALRSCWRRC
ncbi:MAG: hypothetical protein U5K74_06695 [Gemmatimonadaceae bacterium]|nr:hypothetical protein [Gemmatimonadaceae bacterium]